VKSNEQRAKAAFDKLTIREQMTVLDWRELGNNWQDALIGSGVLCESGNRRLTATEAVRQQVYDQVHAATVERRLHNLQLLHPDETTLRRETAEHESSHCVVAMSLGRSIRSVSINDDDPSAGRCKYSEAAGTPLETAVISVAPIVWLEQIRYREFRHLPRGATGCENDLKRAHAAVGYDMQWGFGELWKAFRQAHTILEDNFDAVMSVADVLDREGEYRPYPAQTPRIRPAK
jgi:hypothetical protein